jgi:hypothetical protein
MRRGNRAVMGAARMAMRATTFSGRRGGERAGDGWLQGRARVGAGVGGGI